MNFQLGNLGAHVKLINLERHGDHNIRTNNKN